MINNVNKNISVWRGEKTPPTEYHVWIKSNGSILVNRDGTWLTLISESTNDSVNVCNLSNISRIPSVLAAALVVKLYLGSEVFHVGYKLRYNESPAGYDPVWREYIFTGSTWQDPHDWKLLSTTDLMDSQEIIKSIHLPSYVDDVLEFSTVDKFPPRGESGKIYLDTSTNKSYRWSGTLYVLIALTDIVTSESDGLMSSEMYNKLEKTASDLDIHDKQNLADFTEIRLSLGKKVSKIVDSQGNIISNNASIATIPDGTSDIRGLITPAIYKLVEDNKKMSEYLDDNKVEEIRDFLGTPFPKIGSIVTIPDATTLAVGLMTPDDKIKLDSIESEFVKDLGLVASTDEGDLIAAKSEIAGNINISFIRYRTAGVRAEKVTTIFLWRNGVNETAQLKFVDKALWRRNVIGATGVEGATTSTTPWERTGAHYLGYDAASRTLQLKDYNLTVFRTVLLPLALEGGTDGLLSGKDKMVIGSIITEALFDLATGKATFKNDEKAVVASFTISTATDSRDGLMSKDHVVEIGVNGSHRNNDNNPHNVTKAQVGLGNVTNDAQVKRSEMGVANGVALLNSEGKISSSYLPSYVSDVVTADSYAKLPTTGEEDKIYVTKDTNLTYRWSGTAYVEISPSIALGETSTTAYAGDKGKALSNSVIDLKNRVGNGYVETEYDGFAYIGTGDTKVKIIHGALILASVVGQGTSFTISSNTDTASIGYGASIGLNSVLGTGLSASINNVTGPYGSTRQGIVLKDVNDGNGIKILGRNNGEFLVGTSVYDNNWIDLARLGKISTMINVSSPSGLSIDPSILTENSSDSEISIGTNTTIGSNVTIGSYVEIGEGIILKNDSTGYVLLGDGTTKIKKGVTIDGNSGSSELLVHEHLGSWLIGGDLAPTATTATLGKGIIIVGTSATNQPMLIEAGGATALIGANFNAYSGVTLGSYSSLGNLAKLGDNVEIILGASGLTIVSNDYGMTIGTKVSIGNNVSLGNNVIISNDVSISTSVSASNTGDDVSVGDVTISTGINITKNTATTTILNNNESSKQGGKLTFGTGNIIWDGVEIGTGVHITEDLTADSTFYKLGETNLTTIGKNVELLASLNTYYNGGYILSNPSMRVSTIGDNVLLGSDVTIKDGATIYGGVEIGSGVHITEDLTFDSTSYKLGVTNLATIGKNVKLGASLGIAANVYTLDDPSMNISISTIGRAVTIYSEVTIGTGIQIQDSLAGGLQIYSPSLGRWITIN